MIQKSLLDQRGIGKYFSAQLQIVHYIVGAGQARCLLHGEFEDRFSRETDLIASRV